MALGRHSHRACPLTQWAPLTTWITLLISVTYMASMALSQRTPHNTWHSLYSWYSRNPPFISDISVFFSCFHMFYFAWLRRNGSTLDTPGLKWSISFLVMVWFRGILRLYAAFFTSESMESEFAGSPQSKFPEPAMVVIYKAIHITYFNTTIQVKSLPILHCLISLKLTLSLSTCYSALARLIGAHVMC